MDEETKRMEEGIKSQLNDGGNKEYDLKEEETIQTNKGGSTTEHDKDTLAKPVVLGESEVEQPVVKQKTKRVATLDAFRGLTIVVSVLQTLSLGRHAYSKASLLRIHSNL